MSRCTAPVTPRRRSGGSRSGIMSSKHRAASSSVIAIVAALAAALVFPDAAEAKTYHVSTTGSDEHPGTEAQPLRTIQKAADRARAGDSVLLHGGTYAQTVVLRHSGEQGKSITLASRKG